MPSPLHVCDPLRPSEQAHACVSPGVHAGGIALPHPAHANATTIASTTPHARSSFHHFIAHLQAARWLVANAVSREASITRFYWFCVSRVCGTTARAMRRQFSPSSPRHAALLGRVAANARRLREACGWSQARAAEACDLSLYTYQCIEAGETSFTSTTLALLCDGFAVDAQDFFIPADPPLKRRRGRPRTQREDG